MSWKAIFSMPEIPSLVIVNATPIIALTLIGQLDLLQRLFGVVMTPPAVRAEILAGGVWGIGSAEFQEATWLKVVQLQDPRHADLLVDLDRGEAEVIGLALEVDADLVIIDERLARRHAKRLGLPLTGTVGILLRAKERGMVTSVAPLLEKLRGSGIWLGDSVVVEAMRLAGEI